MALFVFGDSLFDPGNNQYINGTKPDASSYYPYGETFFKHATGRISDGRIVPDFIALFGKLSMPEPYLKPIEHNFSNGISFASGGASVLGTTRFAPVVNLHTQLSYFKKVGQWLMAKMGTKGEKNLLKKAVYLFSIGGNDYMRFASTYPTATSSAQKHQVAMVIANITNVLKEIYEMGGRKIAFQNVGPLGCNPSNRDRKTGICGQPGMVLARRHNRALALSLGKLAKSLPGFKYAIFDYYNALLDRIENPTTYGFKEGEIECCMGIDSGLSCGATRGNVKMYKLCNNASEYVYFDGGHTTEAANWQLAKLIWSGNSKIISPYNVKQLFNLS